jgi:hypothetical protein
MPSTHTPVFTSALKVDGVAVTLKLAAGSSSKYTFGIDLTGAKGFPEPYVFTADNGRLEFVNQVPCTGPCGGLQA